MASDDAKTAGSMPLVLHPPVLILIILSAGVFTFFSGTARQRSTELMTTTAKPVAVFDDSRRLRKADVSADDPYTLQEAPAAFMQRDLQVHDIVDMAVQCFKGKCSAQLEQCHNDPTCKVAVRHYTRNCWTKMQPLCDELIEAGLLRQCPETFRAVYSCFEEASCSIYKMDPMQRHHAYLYKNKHSSRARQDILDITSRWYAAYLDHMAGNGTDEWPGQHAVAVDSSGDPSQLYGHRVSFNVSVFRQHSPDLLEQFTQIAEEADRLYDWGVWTQLHNLGMASPKVRCIELHENAAWAPPKESETARKLKDTADWSEWKEKASDWLKREQAHGRELGQLPYGWHCDDSSMITMALVLSDSEDFDGGQFTQHANFLCGPQVVYDLNPGDLLVWESWRNHVIMPVIRGYRKVLIVELWEHPDADDPRDVGVHPLKNDSTRSVLRPEHQTWMSQRRWLNKHLLH